MTTEGMTPAQLDIAGAIVLGQDRLGELTPWFVGIWLDTVLLGLMLALFGHWQANVASSDRKWVKIMVVRPFVSLPVATYASLALALRGADEAE